MIDVITSGGQITGSDETKKLLMSQILMGEAFWPA
jgi:hypothetical protein